MVSKLRKIDGPRPFTAVKLPTFALIVLLFVTLSCAFDRITDPPATTTPAPQRGIDYLEYTAPRYQLPLAPGQSVPGTGIQYVNRNGQVYNLLFDGVLQFSPGSTRILWDGPLRPGVFASYDLNVTPVLASDNLEAVGVVRLVILNHKPAEINGLPAATITANHYTGILMGETALVGQTIAGTSLRYEGENNGRAVFSETGQSEVHPLDSSFLWFGTLLDNVFVQHTLKVASVTPESVRLEGNVDIWVVPGR